MSESGGKDSPVAQRLRRLRASMGYKTQEPFAEYLGLEHKRYVNFENGLPLSLSAALQIVQKVPGVSMDWLYLGREDALSVSLAARLRPVAGKAKTSA